MSRARAWLAQPDEAEVVAALLVEFRDHNGADWPSDNAFLASVERLYEDRDTEFLLASPMQGSIWKIPVKAGQQVVEGDVVTIIEAMKMENEITAHKAGVIAELPISVGAAVASGDTLAVIADAE